MRIVERACKTTVYRRFTCKKCGCVFDCEKDEYWEKPSGINSLNSTYSYNTTKSYYTCCPECHKVVSYSDIDYNNINTVKLKEYESYTKCESNCQSCNGDCQNHKKK